MTAEQKELAALYAMGTLSGAEARAFRKAMAANDDLRREVEELREAVAELGYLATPVPPPIALKNRVLKEILRPKIEEPAPKVAPRRRSKKTAASSWSLPAWGLSVLLAAAAAWLWLERQSLQEQVGSLTLKETESHSQLEQLRQESSGLIEEIAKTHQQISRLSEEAARGKTRDTVARLQIATLQSTADEFKQGVAVVIWDAEKQQGVLQLEKMPPVAPDKEYQLWVVDLQKKDPVNAGVVRLDAQGFAKFHFKPVNLIGEAAKFALSIEREGGVPKGEGPIVLIGP